MARVALPAVPEVDHRTLTALADRYGIPALDLRQIKIFLPELELVPLEVARAHHVLPVQVNGEAVLLAMADPSEHRVIDELEFVSNRKVFPYVAHREQLLSAIENAYAAKTQGDIEWSVLPNSSSPLGQPTQPTAELRTGSGDPRDNDRAPLRAPPHTTPSSLMRSPRGELALDTALELDPSRAAGSERQTAAEPAPQATRAPTTIPARAPESAPADASRPTSAATANALDSVFSPLSALSTPTVLVVDDEEDIRKLLARVLREKGYRVIEADRGTTALAMVKEHAPDAILLDAMLPEVHGFEVCRRIKSSARFGNTPVLMISAVYRGWRFREDLKSAYGVHDFIEKPFQLREVVRAVEAMINGAPKTEADPDRMAAEAERALHRATETYKAGRLDEAITLLEGAVQLDPLAYRLHYHLALLVARRGDLFRGIQELEAAVQLHPGSFAVLKNLAVLYQQAGFKRKSVEMWERAISHSPDDATRRQIKEHLLSLL
jgi:DNA-binding response OmpR family regulator